WTVGADMSEFNKRFPPGPTLNSILMMYEVPTCLYYLVFRRKDWRSWASAQELSENNCRPSLCEPTCPRGAGAAAPGGYSRCWRRCQRPPSTRSLFPTQGNHNIVRILDGKDQPIEQPPLQHPGFV